MRVLKVFSYLISDLRPSNVRFSYFWQKFQIFHIVLTEIDFKDNLQYKQKNHHILEFNSCFQSKIFLK